MTQVPELAPASPEQAGQMHLLLAVLLLLIVGLGVYPAPFIDLLHPEIKVSEQGRER